MFYQNPGKQGQEIQNSTAELIIGLVQLVPLTHTSELSQEAMEVQNSISAVVVILFINSFVRMMFFALCLGILSVSFPQALLVLHQPETIELWNPDTPIETFWDIR